MEEAGNHEAMNMILECSSWFRGFLLQTTIQRLPIRSQINNLTS
jgi:hypothetical protein